MSDTTKAALADKLEAIRDCPGEVQLSAQEQQDLTEAAALLRANAAVVPDGYALLLDRASRLVEHADFKLGGTLSAESPSREIPSNACSSVKARHLAALRDSITQLAAAPSAPVLAETPRRDDFVRAARVFARAYGQHEDAPGYLPRTPEAASVFEPHGWVIAAMMQAYRDGQFYAPMPVPQQPVQGGGDALDDFILELHQALTKLRQHGGNRLLCNDLEKVINRGRAALALPPAQPAPQAQGVANKRCDYPDCSKACGEARGYCHKAPAHPSPVAQPEARPVQGDAENEVAMAWNAVRTEARTLIGPTGLSGLLAAVEEYGDRRARASMPTSGVPLHVECRECSDCGHTGINDDCGINAACNTCGWSGPSPKEDKCPECNLIGTMTAACPKCAGRYSLVAETDLAAPQPAAARVGLSQDEMWSLWNSQGVDDMNQQEAIAFGRAIEAAHGIASPQEDGGTA